MLAAVAGQVLHVQTLTLSVVASNDQHSDAKVWMGTLVAGVGYLPVYSCCGGAAPALGVVSRTVLC